MKVIAKIETLDLNRNGNQMTPQALDDLCVDAEGKPVLMDFDPDREVGKVLECYRDDEGFARATLDLNLDVEDGLFAVPAFWCNSDDIEDRPGARVFPHAPLTSIGLTTKPANVYLDPIEKKDA